MAKLTLDFTGCKYIGELHKVLKETFDFPDYYGANLDALWDCLDYYCDFDLEVYVKGLSTIPNELDEYVAKILKIFEDVHTDTPNITFTMI